MKTPLLILGLFTAAIARAQTAAPAASVHPPSDTHGVDMRTQSGPPGTARYSAPVPLGNGWDGQAYRTLANPYVNSSYGLEVYAVCLTS